MDATNQEIEECCMCELVSNKIKSLPYKDIEKFVRTVPVKYVDWVYVSRGCGQRTLPFIATYKNYVDWNYISEQANLTEFFILLHKKYIAWEFYVEKNKKANWSELFMEYFDKELSIAFESIALNEEYERKCRKKESLSIC